MKNNEISKEISAARTRVGGFVLAAAAAGFLFAAPAMAHDHEHSDHGHTLTIGDDEDLLEKLIALDEEGIAHMRADIAEARADIEDAIKDVEEAREEVKSVPGGRWIVRIAFTAARAATSEAVKEAMEEAREAIDDAERRLATADVSDEERVETQGAIDGLREDLDDLEAALNELVAALHA